jgi:hypothetical protein
LARGVEPIVAHAALALDGFVRVLVLAWCRAPISDRVFPLRRWPVTLLITLRRACGIPARLTARLPRHWVGTVLGRIPEVCAQRRGLLRPRCGSTFVR